MPVPTFSGAAVYFERIALSEDDIQSGDLLSFGSEEKRKDPRYRFYCENSVRFYGPHCWELDAMNPNDLRRRVVEHIKRFIEPDAWERCALAERAEQASLGDFISKWKPGNSILRQVSE